MNKISSMLDAVADSLEAKGYIKEAHEIDKVAVVLDQISSLLGLTTVPNMTLRDAIKNHLIVLENVIRNAHTASGNQNRNSVINITSALRRCDQLINVAMAKAPAAQGAPGTQVAQGTPK
jgi:hypothetical protein